jgi:hypothetical protein
MTRLCTAFAAVFALLTAAAPARAATLEIFNLNFGNGYTASGSLAFLGVPFPPSFAPAFFLPVCDPPRCLPPPTTLNVYFNGSPLAPYDGRFGDHRGVGNFTGEPLQYFSPFSSGIDNFTTSLDHLPTNFADFFLNDSPAVSGDVSVVPLPATLALFGSAVLGLAGFAASRSRRAARRASKCT